MKTIEEYLKEEFSWHGDDGALINLSVYNTLNWDKHIRGKKSYPNFKLSIHSIKEVSPEILRMKVEQFEGDYSVDQSTTPTTVTVALILVPKVK